MPTWLVEILQPIVISIIGLIFCGIIGPVLTRIRDSFIERTDCQTKQQLIMRAHDIVRGAVMQTEQTIVAKAKAADVWNEDKAEAAFVHASDLIDKLASSEVVDVINECYNDWDEWKELAIEGYVYQCHIKK